MGQRGLAVRLDHIATLRQLRGGVAPDPVAAALMCEQAGATEIWVQLREDGRHIQLRDLRLLREVVQTRLVIQMVPSQQMLNYAYEIKPDWVFFAPDQADERSSDLALDLQMQHDVLPRYMTQLADAGVQLGIVLEPDLAMLRLAHRLGVQAVLLSAAKFAESYESAEEAPQLQRLVDAVRVAKKIGMRTLLGNRLDLRRLRRLSVIAGVDAFVLGHGLLSQALFVGMDQAVRDGCECVRL